MDDGTPTEFQLGFHKSSLFCWFTFDPTLGSFSLLELVSLVKVFTV